MDLQNIPQMQQDLVDMKESLRVFVKKNLESQLGAYGQLGLSEAFKDCWSKVADLEDNFNDLHELLEHKKENQTVVEAA